AASHTPAEARQVVVADLKTSTHVLLVPLQRSAASSSQAPPWDVPVQLVVAEANASAGHVPEVPVQISATSHWPAEPRHVVPAVTNVHDDVQQEPAWPFWAPRSHCSPVSWTPLPQP